LEKNLTQHKADERIVRYKLEAYQKNSPNFIYGSPISIKVFGQDDDSKTRPNRTIQEEEVQIEEPQDLKNGTIQEEEVPLEKP
jgi:hypothetical protein